MAEPLKTESPKPYTPKGRADISLDIDDLSRKAVKHGIGHVFAETFLNLCLMANDMMSKGRFHDPAYKTKPPQEKQNKKKA